MKVTRVLEVLTEIDSDAPKSSLGFGLPNSLLLKWQSAGPDFHKKIPLETAAHADVLLIWWLTNSQASATEADNLTAEYLLNLGAFYNDGEKEIAGRLPYDWLVRLFDCDRDLGATQFRVTLPSSFTMDRRSLTDFQIWIATIERILEIHSALGPKLFRRIAAFATTEMADLPRDGVIAPLTLFGLIYDARPDLRAAFDLTRLDGFHAYVHWFLRAGLLQYRLALELFLDWLRPHQLTSGAPFCGEATFSPVILQAATGLGSELDLIKISGDPASNLAVFSWWLRAARHLVVNDENMRTRIEIVRTIRAFWFHANFGVTRAATPEIPPHLIRLHGSMPELIASYDLAKPEGRTDFIAWWDRTGRHDNPDFNILHREFLFSPALGVEQDIAIPITNAALHNSLSQDISFVHLDLSTSLGRLNFLEYFSHLWSADQLPELRQTMIDELGVSDSFGEDLSNIARQIVSQEPLPIPLTEHQNWWRTEQHNHLYRIGYNSHGLRSLAETTSKPAAAGVSAIVDVEIAGFPRAESGQGEDARTIFQSLKLVSDFKLSLFHTRRWLPTPNLAATNLEQFIAPVLQKAKVRIFAFSAFDMLAEEQFEGLSAFSANHLIGYWPWELSRWPNLMSLPHRIADEIWCSTRFIVDSLTPVTTKPVIHMPLPVIIDMEALRGVDAAADLPRDRFNFLFVFDGFSYFERKNPLGIILAFQRAFPKADCHDVGLTIKAMNANQLPIMLALKMFASADPRINLIYETWDRPRVMQLVASADVLVSLHRSEGFGRLMAEAMLLETPVIVSNYSGNRDFCTDETAFMVGGKLKPVLEDEYIFWNDQEWFDPSVEEAAQHMWSLFSDPRIAKDRIKAARENIQQNYSLEACGRRYSARVTDILAAQ